MRRLKLQAKKARLVLADNHHKRWQANELNHKGLPFLGYQRRAPRVKVEPVAGEIANSLLKRLSRSHLMIGCRLAK
jgi:hypothetical protein